MRFVCSLLSDKMINRISFAFLCIFVLLRPIFTTSFFAQHSLIGFTLLELFGMTSSYLLAIMIFFCLRRLRLDGVSILIIAFCCYVILTLFWGSNYRDGVRFLLPFVIFFSARSILEDDTQIKTIIVLLILGFMVPVVGSSLLIFMKKTLYMTVYQTGIDRYSGMYLKIHTLAHSMLVFIFMVVLFVHCKHSTSFREKVFLYSSYIIAVLAVYNIYKSVTRTVFVGLAIFTSIYLLGRRRYIVLLCGFIIVCSTIFLSSNVQDMLFDIIEPLSGGGKIDDIGSGRIGGWENMLSLFLGSPIEKQILGIGIGNESKAFFGGSHNDLLSLLTSIGYIGFVMYFIIIFKVLFDIVTSKIDMIMKFIFFGIIVSILAMNFGSNSYLSRFELVQYFFLILAMFYSWMDILQTQTE